MTPYRILGTQLTTWRSDTSALVYVRSAVFALPRLRERYARVAWPRRRHSNVALLEPYYETGLIITTMMGIDCEIYHLQELPRYGLEKPYTMRYVPEAGFAVSNVSREKNTVHMKDIRATKDEYSLERNGFIVAQLPTILDYAVFESQEAIESTYFPELEDVLSRQFPGCTVDFVSYLVLTLFIPQTSLSQCAEASHRSAKET